MVDTIKLSQVCRKKDKIFIMDLENNMQKQILILTTDSWQSPSTF